MRLELTATWALMLPCAIFMRILLLVSLLAGAIPVAAQNRGDKSLKPLPQ